ncbi:MAG: TonB family protein [Cyanobacteria bacterium P01_G01_bin.54]
MTRLKLLGTPTALSFLIAGVIIHPLGDRSATLAKAPLLQNPVNTVVLGATQQKNEDALDAQSTQGSIDEQENDSVICQHCPIPDNPDDRIEQSGIGTSVRILVEYDSNGYVTGAQILESSGDVEVDRAALEATQHYRLETNGRSGKVPITVEFSDSAVQRSPTANPAEDESAAQSAQGLTDEQDSESDRIHSISCRRCPRPVYSDEPIVQNTPAIVLEYDSEGTVTGVRLAEGVTDAQLAESLENSSNPVVLVEYDREGRVTDAQLMVSSGDGILDRAALIRAQNHVIEANGRRGQTQLTIDFSDFNFSNFSVEEILNSNPAEDDREGQSAQGSIDAQESAHIHSIRCRRCPSPAYSYDLIDQGIEGSVQIILGYDSEGRVTDVRLAESSGHAELDRSALEAASNYRLETHGHSGEIPMTINFSIHGSERHQRIESERNRGVE